MKISKPTEFDYTDKPFNVIVAGPQGIGKTTLALSAPNPLLLDLDGGADRVRAVDRKDTAYADGYDDLIDFLSKKENLAPYDTIVIDTGGKLFDFIKPHVLAQSSVNGKTDGSLSLKGYGVAKQEFRKVTQLVKEARKNLVITFHATEVMLPGDVTGLRIRVEGSTKDEVWDDVDFGGFLENEGGKRVITFGSTFRFYGKGTHGVEGRYEIPDLRHGAPNDFLATLFADARRNMQEEVGARSLYDHAMAELCPVIDAVKDIKSANSCAKQVLGYEGHALTSKQEAWARLARKAKALGLRYDKQAGAFVDA